MGFTANNRRPRLESLENAVWTAEAFDKREVSSAVSIASSGRSSRSQPIEEAAEGTRDAFCLSNTSEVETASPRVYSLGSRLLATNPCVSSPAVGNPNTSLFCFAYIENTSGVKPERLFISLLYVVSPNSLPS